MIDERINRDSIIERLPKWILPSLLERSGKFNLSFRSISQVSLLIRTRFHNMNCLVFQEKGESPGFQ